MRTPPSFRALVVDDEPIAREGVRRMLSEDPEIVEIRACAGAAEALRELSEGHFDLLLVDVQMPGMSGLELIEAHGQERAPVTVFLTAYERYAIEAFEAGAVDYLLKPFSDERFQRALERAKQQVRQRRSVAGIEPATSRRRMQPLERLIVRSGGGVIFVRLEDIDWIEAADYYTLVHTGTKHHLARVSLRHLERCLSPDAFVRIHRRAIVRIDRIRSVRRDRGGSLEVELINGKRLPVSRRLRERLRDRLRV